MAKSKRKSKQGQRTAKSGQKPISRPARGKIAARRGARGRATKAKPQPRKQTFVASHHRPDAFEQGLRRYAQYRDLGNRADYSDNCELLEIIIPADFETSNWNRDFVGQDLDRQ